MTSVLLATSSNWPDGEPGAPALVDALERRGIDAAWARWDDAGVDWAAADLVAVRSTWDYTERAEEFLAWAREVDGVTRLLNGADVFTWNHDKAYLAGLDGATCGPHPHRRHPRRAQAKRSPRSAPPWSSHGSAPVAAA